MKYIYGLIILVVVVVGGGFLFGQKGKVPPLETPTDNLIRITYPKPGDEITSPLTVTGEARGNWYFEASFPLEVVDSTGNIIGQKYVEAQGDWMTTEFVSFRGTVEFTTPTTTSKEGKIIFRKDNPSGLPEHDAQVEVPIRFK